MPGWAQWLLAAAAVVTALGVLWNKVLNPLRKAVARIEEAVPLIVTASDVFSDWPDAMKVLREMASQFKTDHGSSLRDVVNELASASKASAAHSQVFAVGVEAAKQLAERDRQEVQRLMLQLDRVTAKVDDALNALAAIKVTAGGVAVDLALAQHMVDGVAVELAAERAETRAAQDRADATPPDRDPGEASDAASRSAPPPADRLPGLRY